MSDKREFLHQIGAIVTNSHIVYTSGKHGSSYVNKDAIYPHTEITSQLCLEIASHFKDTQIEVVVAPAIGGVILSQWVAFHLTQILKKEVLGVYAEKNDDAFIIRRGYEKLCASKRILVVEDILTTGGSVKKVVEAVRSVKGNIVGVAALCNRGNIKSEDLGNVPELYSLIQVQLDSWEEKDCPLCQQGIPINKNLGKGKK